MNRSGTAKFEFAGRRPAAIVMYPRIAMMPSASE
jgi:hypothetical protein